MWKEWINNVTSNIVIDEFWSQFSISVLRILLLIVIGRLLAWILHKSINKIVLEQLNVRHASQKRRITTIGKLLNNMVSYTIYFIIGLLVLSELGISLGPLIAGAGIAGIAIGFGAQSLVKDVITGFFIVLEDQFAVGDMISTGKFKGKVEVIGLRTTRIVNEKGEVHIVPNSLITEVTNFSLHAATVSLDIAIAYQSNLRYIMQIVKQCAETLEHEKIIGQPTVLGIQQFDKDEIVMRIEVQCEATYEDTVKRYMNERFKLTLEEHSLQMNEQS
ncbi:mechanosensitive ion channel protein MscS [Paenibacillus montaniterrae]|uniref:Mechanosensitive ion channel protein MscS n=1 Tax=Paenibacillus montaniterrae TaxID=429341 RepID=A0A919YSJ3_9BACL|nr:mechanosensitive ion channel family protein [Paenibacillus montaniterrae]GIP18432.1 mechanosensitive ion channel protein MscS [Paenibacillus montaniterrae]